MSTKVILLIGTELSGFAYLGILLKQLGHEVFLLRHWEQSIETLEEQLPDLVIIDDQRPELCAIHLCETLSEHPSIAHVPRILLLSSRSDDVKTVALAAGASGIITKPMLPQQLLHLVSDLID